jgi:hypothetical protein
VTPKNRSGDFFDQASPKKSEGKTGKPGHRKSADVLVGPPGDYAGDGVDEGADKF